LWNEKQRNVAAVTPRRACKWLPKICEICGAPANKDAEIHRLLRYASCVSGGGPDNPRRQRDDVRFSFTFPTVDARLTTVADFSTMEKHVHATPTPRLHGDALESVGFNPRAGALDRRAGRVTFR